MGEKKTHGLFLATHQAAQNSSAPGANRNPRKTANCTEGACYFMFLIYDNYDFLIYSMPAFSKNYTDSRRSLPSSMAKINVNIPTLRLGEMDALVEIAETETHENEGDSSGRESAAEPEREKG